MSGSSKGGFQKNNPHSHVHIHAKMVLSGHKRGDEKLCFSPESTLLASLAHKEGVRIWDVSKQMLIGELERAAIGIPLCMTFSQGSLLVAASGEDGTIRLWTGRGKIVGELSLRNLKPSAATFSPDTKLLVTGDRAGNVRVWQRETGILLNAFRGAPHGGIPSSWESTMGVDAFTFTANGQRLALESGDQCGLVQVWDMQSSGQGVSWVGAVIDAKASVFAIAFSPDGCLLAVSEFDRDVVHLFDGQSLAPIVTLNVPDDVAKVLAFSPDSRYLATGGGEAGMVWLWEMASGQIVASFAAQAEGADYRTNSQEWALAGIAWSPDGRLIATSGIEPATVKLWEVRVGE